MLLKMSTRDLIDFVNIENSSSAMFAEKITDALKSYISEGVRRYYIPAILTVSHKGRICSIWACKLRRYVGAHLLHTTGPVFDTRPKEDISSFGSSNVVQSNTKFLIAMLIDSQSPGAAFPPQDSGARVAEFKRDLQLFVDRWVPPSATGSDNDHD